MASHEPCSRRREEADFEPDSRVRLLASAATKLRFMERVHADCLLPTRRAFVQLDVAAARVVASQIATGEVAVGQLDLEYVVAPRLAFVARAHAGGAGRTVNRDVVVNDPARWVV